MRRLRQAIELYNASKRKYWDSGCNTRIQLGPDRPRAAATGGADQSAPPDPLREFYLQVGGLQNHNNNESHCIDLPRPAQLADGLQRFDEQGRFGAVPYDQDCLSDLRKILDASPARQSLDEKLCEVIERPRP